MMNKAKKLDAQTEVMHIVLHDTELSIDRNNFSDILFIYYSIQKPGEPPRHDEVVIYEDDWEYDFDGDCPDELMLSNVVNILNLIGNKGGNWFFNGSKHEASSNDVKGIILVSNIGTITQDSAKHIQEHYFEMPFEVA